MSKRIDFNSIVSKLRAFYTRHKRLPSFSEIQKLLHYQSKGGVSRLIPHLIERGVIRKDSKGKLLPTPLLEGMGIKLLGEVQAGFPSPAEEELVDTLSLDDFLVRKPEASYLLKVSGDSMIEAGICPNDLVIVERGRQPGNGDIVIAQVDGEWTMKYYYRHGRQVVLRPANRKYQPIRPREELTIGGIVIACVRKYKNK
jgi:SOS regulatory protein LexA